MFRLDLSQLTDAFEPDPLARLLGSFPNPFNPNTDLRFSLGEQASVTLEIYDGSGRLVREILSGSTLPAGEHSRRWDGRDRQGRPAPSGVYLVRLRAGDLRDALKIHLIK